MTKQEAEALAEKREAHKSKHMTNKEWRAKHDSVKGWHVALVDSVESLLLAEVAAREKARRAVLRGDADAFLAAASDALLAQVRRKLGETA